MAVGFSAVPEIPLISLISSTPEEILQALSTVGFIHLDVEGTGLTENDIDRAFELSTLLHSLPLEDRTSSLKDARGNGYFDIKGSLDERISKADLKESFVWGRFNAKAGEVETTQILPSPLQKYREEIVAFDNKCFEASLRVLDRLSQAFDLPESFFRSMHKTAGSNGMAFLNYPAPAKPPMGDDIRAGSHKDWQWGDVTLLFQQKNGQPGLQIYLPTEDAKKQKGMQLIQGDVDLESGIWISAPIIPKTILVNVGLALEAMTDGLCKANVHRVIFPAAEKGHLPKNRKTIAYFSTPDHDVVGSGCAFNGVFQPILTPLAKIMNPVKSGGIIMENPGATTVGEFFFERQRLAGVV